MDITIKLFANLRETREKESVMEVPEGISVEEVVRLLEIPVEEAAIIMINGRGKKLDAILKDNDVLALFPPVGGG